MRAVSNTSPLSNLAIIGQLDLLKRRYPSVLIPPTVRQELDGLSHPEARSRIAVAFREGWLQVSSVPILQPKLIVPLDLGETDAIGLALAVGADVLLIDERRGRQAARSLGIAVGGLLGELLYARHCGLIPNLRTPIERLKAEAFFFIDAEIERYLLSQVGEA